MSIRQWRSIAMVRLQKYMADCGVASRRACEEIILAGRVRVNGEIVRELGVRIDEAVARVEVDGKPISLPHNKYYIMLNKPRGYVSTAKDQFDRPTVLDLVGDLSARLYPIGRLDYDSQGLLLLTNDGAFANRLMHPRHQVQKTYRAHVRGHVSRDAVDKLRRGVLLDTGMTAPAKVHIAREMPGSTVLDITIAEGKNRQVRKMCESVGHTVVRLTRTGEGGLTLGNLPEGKWRHLTPREVQMLMEEGKA